MEGTQFLERYIGEEKCCHLIYCLTNLLTYVRREASLCIPYVLSSRHRCATYHQCYIDTGTDVRIRLGFDKKKMDTGVQVTLPATQAIDIYRHKVISRLPKDIDMQKKIFNSTDLCL